MYVERALGIRGKMLFMSDTVQRVKEKLSIVDVVSPYVKLTRAGKNYKGLSPFNKEKTPSFFVSPERGTYYCFSSSQGGDMFSFIEKMEGLDFKGALKVLAEKAGVPLEEYRGGSAQDKSKTDRLREAMAHAEAFFTRSLDEKGSAYEYARSRGLTEETIRTWGLGYAPDAWRSLLEALAQEGFTVPELLAAGLVKEADGKPGTYYDRFRNRLMFPIRDAAGRTVAFTGRALSPDDQAKYLNSPETELFKKSQVLFGMNLAKDAIRSRGFALLVEGQFDLILSHQIGFGNAIALSGTALSREHLGLVKRYAENLMLMLDADRAGLAASAKNAMAALASGMRVKAVRIAEGKDPADLAVADPAAFVESIKNAQPVVEFFLSVLSEKEKDSHRLVLTVERIVLPLIAAMQSSMEKEHFVGVVARSLGLTPEAVRAAVPKAGTLPAEPEEKPQVVEVEAPKAEKPMSLPEEELVAVCAAYPGTPLAEKVQSEYARITGNTLPDALPSERRIIEAEREFGEAPSENGVLERIRRFERLFLEGALIDARRELADAERTGDKEKVREISAAINSINARRAACA